MNCTFPSHPQETGRYHYTGPGQAKVSEHLKKHERTILAWHLRGVRIEIIAAAMGVGRESIRRRIAAAGLARRRGRMRLMAVRDVYLAIPRR